MKNTESTLGSFLCLKIESEKSGVDGFLNTKISNHLILGNLQVCDFSLFLSLRVGHQVVF